MPTYNYGGQNVEATAKIQAKMLLWGRGIGQEDWMEIGYSVEEETKNTGTTTKVTLQDSESFFFIYFTVSVSQNIPLLCEEGNVHINTMLLI